MSKACPDLLGAWGREDGSANTGGEKSSANVARKSGLMA